ncbi:hypothetical protein B7H23_03315 [Notoacmeibacter marinus]|uniref:Uncharacterized protein n=1 Tax=Notoacmeibacter marinus TaxID=1876515 RepID=A0A231V1G3_9HYPH|nr:hypothetical protein [Notoacmeibacter marinus]OXT01980.1 hypothetical protein B7H23_03315 [Notoacmeibacter marinus]
MTNWRNELALNHGRIFLPDGHWVTFEEPTKKTWDGDIWCDPKEEIDEPLYEQGLARFMESVVAAGHCGRSGTQRFNFVHQHLTDRAKGDLFDWTEHFIDREVRSHRPEDEVTICDAFGKAPRRTMNRLKERVETPRETSLQEGMLWRICYLSIARKCFLARIGYPEFCERQVS